VSARVRCFRVKRWTKWDVKIDRRPVGSLPRVRCLTCSLAFSGAQAQPNGPTERGGLYTAGVQGSFFFGRLNSSPQAGYLGRIARTAFPRWCGLAANRTCAGGLLLRRQVGEHATESRWLSRSSFPVNLEGVGSGGAQSLLAAPRRRLAFDSLSGARGVGARPTVGGSPSWRTAPRARRMQLGYATGEAKWSRASGSPKQAAEAARARARGGARTAAASTPLGPRAQP
jgi:hypothetical protein